MKHSIRTKILAIFICMTFVIAVFSELVLCILLNELEISRAVTEQQRRVRATAEEVDDILSTINSCGGYAMLDKDLYNYARFSENDAYLINRNESKLAKKYSDMYSVSLDNKIKKCSKTFFVNQSLSKNNLLMDGSVFKVNSSSAVNLYTDKGIENESWVIAAKKKNGTLHVFERSGMICVAQLIKNETGLGDRSEYIGISLIVMDLSEFLDKMTDSVWNTEAAIRCNNKIITKSVGYSEGNGRAYIKSRAEAYVGIEFITMTEKNSVKIGYADSGKIMLLNVVVIVILGILLSLWLSQIITKPINALAKQMKRVEKDNLDSLKLYYNSGDELGEIYNSFNYMLTEMTRLMKKAEADAEEKRILEIRMYQNRINPHFLYNTLDCISWSALLNGNDKICKMNKMLSQVYRYSISGDEFMAKLSEELEHISYYAELQEMRLGRKITVMTYGTELFDKISISKCTLQPLIENSVLHGMPDDMDELKIDIIAEIRQDNIYVTFGDNGIGCDAEAVNRYINDDGDASSIGLRNVSQRIKLRYGSGYGLCVCKNDPKGTKIIIKLPLSGETEE